MNAGLAFRRAGSADAPLLARLNRELIRDEGHRTSLTLPQLQQRMQDWLAGDYEAVIFDRTGDAAGYTLFRREREYVYIRQFFVCRHCRRSGVGRAAIEWLRRNVWADAPRLRLDVLVHNVAGREFWNAVGFSDYCVTMESDADHE